ncbi:hypothetical protein ACJD0Z_09285 [Flavobacteriaceae bacterium M23B6Z8]
MKKHKWFLVFYMCWIAGIVFVLSNSFKDVEAPSKYIDKKNHCVKTCTKQAPEMVTNESQAIHRMTYASDWLLF